MTGTVDGMDEKGYYNVSCNNCEYKREYPWSRRGKGPIETEYPGAKATKSTAQTKWQNFYNQHGCCALCGSSCTEEMTGKVDGMDEEGYYIVTCKAEGCKFKVKCAWSRRGKGPIQSELKLKNPPSGSAAGNVVR
eukprot:CAMPEP_0170177744 /NCGR_PEP_ID=MMETSP0040_2-20121228/10940_1 /TAXON_ID=641309 /ORGANISM="Lotharella oceanica, Strain CCMP622" /LENGTH=134 /DNA_ID=CAMNT_0010420509 /DNA_START=127 /DNA_END=531 /DNA_ORIENTATION=+